MVFRFGGAGRGTRFGSRPEWDVNGEARLDSAGGHDASRAVSCFEHRTAGGHVGHVRLRRVDARAQHVAQVALQ